MKRALAAAVLVLLPLAAEAAADGLPLVDYGIRPDGVDVPGAGQRLAAIPAGREMTVVARIDHGSGRVLTSRALDGELAVPAVAYDGTAGGLTANGGTLALIEPRRRFPRTDTKLVLLDRWLDPIRRIHLEGDFSFDAIAPDGSAIFLVEYPNRRDPSVYRVRIYDMVEDELLEEPLLDSRTAAIVMRGLPITRATTPDGRTAYTLYDGGGDPFVHALDTVGRSALCIPLPGKVRPARVHGMRLDMRADGREFTVVSGRRDVAIVDTAAASARRPGAEPAAPETQRQSAGGGGGAIAGLGAAALLLAGGLLRRRHAASSRRSST